MSGLKTVLKVLFIISFAVFVGVSIYKPPLPNPENVVDQIKMTDPVQTPAAKQAFNVNFEGFVYTIKPKYSYQLFGLVVTDYDSSDWADIRHKEDPGNIKDICVVWGENIKNGSFKKVRYKSGEFTCYYQWSTKPDPPFDGRFLANNHVIPANSYVATILKKVAPGDQIFIKGYLADYEVVKDGKTVFTRTTSSTRDDTGNGACEIVFVEDVVILQGKNAIWRLIKTYSFWTTALSLASSILLFFFVP